MRVHALQVLCRKGFKRQPWRFHVKYLTWVSELQATTGVCKQGVYVSSPGKARRMYSPCTDPRRTKPRTQCGRAERAENGRHTKVYFAIGTLPSSF